MKWSTIICDKQMLSHVLCVLVFRVDCLCVSLILIIVFFSSLFFHQPNETNDHIRHCVWMFLDESRCMDVLMWLCPVWMILCNNWCMDTHHLVHFSFRSYFVSFSLFTQSPFSSKKLQLEARRKKEEKIERWLFLFAFSFLYKRNTRWFTCVTGQRWIFLSFPFTLSILLSHVIRYSGSSLPIVSFLLTLVWLNVQN